MVNVPVAPMTALPGLYRILLFHVQVPLTVRSSPVPLARVRSAFCIRAPPVLTTTWSADTALLMVTSCIFRIVIPLEFSSGESVAGLTTPEEKSGTGELSQVAGVLQSPVAIVLK